MTNDDFFAEDNYSEDEFLSEDNGSSEKQAQKNSSEDIVLVSKKKLTIIKNIIARQKEDCKKLTDFFEIILPGDEVSQISIGQLESDFLSDHNKADEEGKIVEGVFDGENMIGPDGKKYSMPSNYASKSKLVEGDIMKLSILGDGTFVYKQIGPAKRKRVVGTLKGGKEGEYYVEGDKNKWKILTASVTYFKGIEGDEVVLLVPAQGESKWGAVENIINKQKY